MKEYGKLLFTLLISFLIMYGVMFLNVDKVEHVYFSVTRVYMALLMVSPMSVLMLLIMRNKYGDRRINALIIVISVSAFLLALVFLRTQAFIGDEDYMRAMIPHHSSAILTSQEASIEDSEVKNLSNQIIEAQREEIVLMKKLLEKLD